VTESYNKEKENRLIKVVSKDHLEHSMLCYSEWVKSERVDI